ncbi:P-loop containing nucleoside triphosphate hydrolase protein, partial [Rozella allomycis CSF55]
VSVKNVTKIYPGAKIKALNDVSLEFAKNEIFGLIGFNGAGKSTLINIITGILSPTAGHIKVFGVDSSKSKNRGAISQRIGICQQQDILFQDLTVGEHLYYFGKIRGVKNSELKDIIEGIVEDLRMGDMLDKFAQHLSGGQKRKLCIAIAFVSNPELVVLDEMSSGVDPDNRRVIW